MRGGEQYGRDWTRLAGEAKHRANSYKHLQTELLILSRIGRTRKSFIHCSHPNITYWTFTLCLSLCRHRWAYYQWLLHRVDQECSKIPSGQSAQHLQTHLDSVFMVCTYTHVFSTSVLLTIICILHFLEQWIVNPSNMDLIFGSIILVWLCCSYNTLFKLLEENIDTFVKNELKKSQRVLR